MSRCSVRRKAADSSLVHLATAMTAATIRWCTSEPLSRPGRGRAHAQAGRGRPDRCPAHGGARQGPGDRQGRAEDQEPLRWAAGAAHPREPAPVPGARAGHRQSGRDHRSHPPAHGRPRPADPGAGAAGGRRPPHARSGARAAPLPHAGRGLADARHRVVGAGRARLLLEGAGGGGRAAGARALRALRHGRPARGLRPRRGRGAVPELPSGRSALSRTRSLCSDRSWGASSTPRWPRSAHGPTTR